MSRKLPLVAILLSLIAVPALAAEEPHGCDKFKWPVEREREVAPLDPGQVLDEAEQVRAGRHQRTPDVVLAQPVELPQQRLAAGAQVSVQVILRV